MSSWVLLEGGEFKELNQCRRFEKQQQQQPVYSSVSIKGPNSVLIENPLVKKSDDLLIL